MDIDYFKTLQSFVETVRALNSFSGCADLGSRD